jgi:FKBP-type peptidyl-prolyl cis-trans isomerase 2
MKSILSNTLMLVLLAGMTACLGMGDSNTESVIERDDNILKEFLAANNIEAKRTQAGYYYTTVLANDGAKQITNNTIVGIYYEIRTIDGHLIDSYTEEDGEPVVFLHGEAGMVPKVVSHATGLAREGEVLRIYSPSYLAYFDYRYEQLIQPNSNLVIDVTYAKIFTADEIKELEDQKIQDFLAASGLEGYERLDNGAYVKVLRDADEEGVVIENGNVVWVNFELFQLGDASPFVTRTATGGGFDVRAGSAENLKFVNISTLGQKTTSKVEVIAPSHLAYGASTLVLPELIREDLFQKNLILDRVRPYHPVRFIVDIKRKA